MFAGLDSGGVAGVPGSVITLRESKRGPPANVQNDSGKEVTSERIETCIC